MKNNFQQDIYYKDLEIIKGIKFTHREIDIASCILSGRTSKNAIASFLSIKPRTVESHTRNIMQKLECNSWERIRDFFETSGKAVFIREHYQFLLPQAFFEKSLEKIHILIKREELKCFLIYNQDQEDAKIFTLQLETYFRTIGIKTTLIGTREDIYDPIDHPTYHILYILSDAEIEKFQKEKYKEKILKIIQKSSEIKSTVQFLLLNKENPTNIPSELVNFGYTDFSQKQDYYFAFYKILKKILPKINIDQIEADFQLSYTATEFSFDQKNSLKTLARTTTDPIISIGFKKNVKAYIVLKEKLIEIRKIIKKYWYALILLLLLVGAFYYKKEIIQELKVAYNYLFKNGFDNLPVHCENFQPRVALQILKEKISKFSKEKVAKIAITGISGSGKTELAKDFALNYRNSWVHPQKEYKIRAPIIWWLNATTPDSLFFSWQDLAIQLGIKKKQEEDTIGYKSRILKEVKEFLSRNPGWLLIFDDAPTVEQIGEYLPNDNNNLGTVLVTTQNSDFFNNPQQELSISAGLENDEALTLAYRICPFCKEEDLLFLTNTIGYLPLSLSVTVKHFMIENEYRQKFSRPTLTGKEYVNNYILTSDKNRKAFANIALSTIAKKNQFYKDTQEKVISIALKNIDQNYKRLLSYCALMNIRILTWELLEDFIQEAKISLDNSTTLNLSAEQALEVLLMSGQDRSLLHIAQETSGKKYISMHQITQNQILDLLNEEAINVCKELFQKEKKRLLLEEKCRQKKIWEAIEPVFNIVGRRLKESNKEKNYRTLRYWLLHMDELLSNYSNLKGDFSFLFSKLPKDFLITLATAYYGISDWNRAAYLLKIGLENSLDPNIKAAILYNLGWIYSNALDFENAKKYLNEALELYGDEYNKERATTEHELGAVYLNESLDDKLTPENKISKLDEAEKHLENALKLKEKIASEHSPKTSDSNIEIALTLHMLGRVCIEKRELSKAEKFLWATLDIQQKNGAKKEDIIVTKYQLGRLYYNLGKLDIAKEETEEALKLARELYGDDNNTAISAYLFGLGEILLKQGKLEAAEDKIIKSLEIDKNFYFNPDHFRLRRSKELLNIIKEKYREKNNLTNYQGIL